MNREKSETFSSATLVMVFVTETGSPFSLSDLIVLLINNKGFKGERKEVSDPTE
jgi:hypothetical protein